MAVPAAITAVGALLGTLGSSISKKKESKKNRKEVKRKTFADLLNESLRRSHETEMDTRRSQSDLAGARAKAIQEMAAGYRQSLR